MSKFPNRFLRVGITGGIGSGKSTVCNLFAGLGRTVLSADDIARQLTDNSAQIKSSIRKTFGEKVFLPNGVLDRQALAAIVFENHSLRAKLDALIHPHVFAALDEAIDRLSLSDKSSYLLIEAALIYESGMDEKLDYVVVVHADEEVRIKRVLERDNTTREAVLARMYAQMDPKQKIELADFVIVNDNDEHDLVQRVKFLDTLLCMMSRQPKT